MSITAKSTNLNKKINKCSSEITNLEELKYVSNIEIDKINLTTQICKTQSIQTTLQQDKLNTQNQMEFEQSQINAEIEE